MTVHLKYEDTEDKRWNGGCLIETRKVCLYSYIYELYEWTWSAVISPSDLQYLGGLILLSLNYFPHTSI